MLKFADAYIHNPPPVIGFALLTVALDESGGSVGRAIDRPGFNSVYNFCRQHPPRERINCACMACQVRAIATRPQKVGGGCLHSLILLLRDREPMPLVCIWWHTRLPHDDHRVLLAHAVGPLEPRDHLKPLSERCYFSNDTYVCPNSIYRTVQLPCGKL